MKNIHLIPTDKSSRLYLHSENELQLRTNIIRTSEDYLGSNQHIYITSDEEIKEGDYVYDSKDNVIRYVKKYLKDDWIKKIILTTDQDLIKDGVQAINDEFLEWFVQNPSCEVVEIKTEYLGSKCLKCGFIENHDEVNTEYCPKCKNTTYEHLYNHNKIIIPKEEVKKIYYNTVGKENGVNVVKGQFNTQKEALDLANELNRKYPDLYYDWRKTLIKEEPKQEWTPTQGEQVWIKVFSNWSSGTYIGYDTTKHIHLVRENEEGGGNLLSSSKILPYKSMPNEPKKTLEEAAENEASIFYEKGTIEWNKYRQIFKDGAKWQQERMYSEKDLVNLLNFVSKEYNIGNGIGWFYSHESIEEISSVEVLGKWFEQNKKK